MPADRCIRFIEIRASSLTGGRSAAQKTGPRCWISGNAGGRPKAAHNIQELARAHAPEAIERLAQIVKTGDRHSAVVAAANAILDLAYGKPAQFNTCDAQSFKKAIDMTDDELAAIVGRAKLTLVKSDA